MNTIASINTTLGEYKEIYEAKADLYLPNWRNTGKNKLILECCECNNQAIRESYISAIMAKYWYKLDMFYKKCKRVATPEDVHSWLVSAVMYAVDNQPWTKEDSSIYNDVNGPDKVINRVIESKRLTYYQQLQHAKRKILSESVSLNSLVEDCADYMTPSYSDEYKFETDQLVKNYFDKKDYFMAFLIDALAYETSYITNDIKRFAAYFSNLDNIQCNVFADRYGYEFDKVLNASKYITKIPRATIKKKINDSERLLRIRLWFEGEYCKC